MYKFKQLSAPQRPQLYTISNYWTVFINKSTGSVKNSQHYRLTRASQTDYYQYDKNLFQIGLIMIASQRESIILELLSQNGVLSMDEIATHCNCSVETARRDLNRLDKHGQLKRTHGGAEKIQKPQGSSLPGSKDKKAEAREALLARCRVLIITPTDTNAMRLMVQRALHAGKKLITESNPYPGAHCLIGTNNYLAGFELGRWVGNYAQQNSQNKQNVLILSCHLPNTQARSDGFLEGFKLAAPHESTTLTIYLEGFFNSARQAAFDVLSVHPEINVIFGINDDTALGALEAYRSLGLDEKKLLLIPFGLEGKASKDLLSSNGPCQVALAMFPELVGQACIKAAALAAQNQELPPEVSTPFAILTPHSLKRFYRLDQRSGQWNFSWEATAYLPASDSYAQLNTSINTPQPTRMAYMVAFSSHEWYQQVKRSMLETSQRLGAALEIFDASQDITNEIYALQRLIGKYAADQINEGETIILDAGLPTAFLANALHGRDNITILTNSLLVLNELCQEEGLNIISCGGTLRSQSQALVGAEAEAAFANIRVDKAFISCSGVSVDFGLSTGHNLEARIKRAMLSAAREVFILADSTKFGQDSLVKFSPLEKSFCIITDANLRKSEKLIFNQLGLSLILVEETL
jgi:DeoR/GlpR family transcriptional regulator of sugar metabolism